jgi:hypothetical protein
MHLKKRGLVQTPVLSKKKKKKIFSSQFWRPKVQNQETPYLFGLVARACVEGETGDQRAGGGVRLTLIT